jgi:hypothetical protein
MQSKHCLLAAAVLGFPFALGYQRYPYVRMPGPKKSTQPQITQHVPETNWNLFGKRSLAGRYVDTAGVIDTHFHRIYIYIYIYISLKVDPTQKRIRIVRAGCYFNSDPLGCFLFSAIRVQYGPNASPHGVPIGVQY